MEESNHDSPNDSVTSLATKMQNLWLFPSESCIYRVPQRLRHENAKAYTPKVVSIGPIHHGEKGLQAMEEYKLLYLKYFLRRTGVVLEDYFEFIKNREEKLRNHYAESFRDIGSNQFVEMVVVDAAFVTELLLRNHSKDNVEQNDPIFYRPWKNVDIRYDMMLLENQLPFFIFEDIFCHAKLMVRVDNNIHGISSSNEKISLIILIHAFFKFKAYLGEIKEVLRRMKSSNIKHFLDLFRKCHVPGHLPPGHKIETLTIPSVTELSQAGAKFEAGKNVRLFDIKFCNGTLVIPHLRIRKSTESFFLNLVAFEQCHTRDLYITNYIFIIQRFVNSTRDVQLLVQNGIIESKLPDNQEVVTSINNLVRGSVLKRKRFFFSVLCDGLNTYYSNRWNHWKAAVKHHHFSSPLTIFAVSVATAVFILTVIQTVCSCGVQFR